MNLRPIFSGALIAVLPIISACQESNHRADPLPGTQANARTSRPTPVQDSCLSVDGAFGKATNERGKFCLVKTADGKVIEVPIDRNSSSEEIRERLHNLQGQTPAV
jgi:hypothetical protein